MKKESISTIKELGYYSSIGLSVSLSIVIGYFLGAYLDKRFHTDPWLMLVGLVFGIAAGYRNIGYMIKKIKDADQAKT